MILDQKDDYMDLKKHIDTLAIIGAIISCVLWMNGRFNEIDSRFHELENRLTKIETVLIMKNIYPSELAHTPLEERKYQK